MKLTDLFFSQVIDLQHHTLPAHIMDALHAVYSACRAINQPQKYGPAIKVIIIDAIHQDYDSKFHKPAIDYDPVKKILEAAVKVDLDKILGSTFLEAIELYKELIFQVLDQARARLRREFSVRLNSRRSRPVEDYNFEQLKRDLQGAIREEASAEENR